MRTAERVNNFNLIRLVLALLVIFGHSPELIDGNRSRELLTRIFGTLSLGEFAVDGFFLISGYLIVQSWNSNPDAWHFLRKRLLRIYPGFIISSLICAFLVGPIAASSGPYFAAFNGASFFTGLAFLDTPRIPAVFDGTHYAAVNDAMWTISKEFECYLFVLAVGALGALRARYFCLALTVVVFALQAWCKHKGITVVELRLGSFFLSGACYYIYRHQIRFDGRTAAVAALITMLCMFSWRASELALASIGGYTLLYVASKRSALLSKFNRLPDVSYGVYLYGWPIQKLALWYHPTLSPLALFIVSSAGALLAGWASWHLIEKPALRFKGPALQTKEEDERPLALSATCACSHCAKCLQS